MESGDQTSLRLTNALKELIPRWFEDEKSTTGSQSISEIEYLSGGYSNENYRLTYAGQRYVLRLPERDRPFVDRGHEHAFYEHESGVRIPELIAYDEDTGVMLTRYVSGRLVCDVDLTAEAFQGNLISYLRELHEALPESDRRYDPVLLSREFLSDDAPDWIQQLADRLKWHPKVCTPCHNDLNPWNIIVQPGEAAWITLDWEWFGDNDPLFDLVTLHQGLELSNDSLASMAEEYLQGTCDPGRLEGCLQAFWLREYAWAHAELTNGNERPEIRTQLDTSESRLRALID